MNLVLSSNKFGRALSISGKIKIRLQITSTSGT